MARGLLPAAPDTITRALDEFIVDGIDTTLPLLRDLVRNEDIQNGDYDIHWLEEFLKSGAAV